MRKIQLLLFISVSFLIACNVSKDSTGQKVRKVELQTDMGTMVLKLYNETPLHRDNFIKLVEQHFYDSLMFHRVIDSFMIQGGDPNSKRAPEGIALGEGAAPGIERIPAEFKTHLIHKKGALAAARDNNPQKASSNCQFYIVQGKMFVDTALNGVECRRVRPNAPGFAYTEKQRELYRTIGGTPHLDQNYTVFGEVIKGMEVIDKIAKMKRDARNRPTQDVRMKMRMLN
jgi:cyclophilin family peptidyl-prolyl cis-trans isomerase